MTVNVRYARTEAYRPIHPGEPSRPYLPVRIQRGGRYVDTLGIVDSGADNSLFDKQIALVLGLTLDPSTTEPLDGVGGTSRGWYYDLFSVAGKRFPARVCFADWRLDCGLLGRADFFKAFNVGFDQRNSRFHLHPLS